MAAWAFKPAVEVRTEGAGSFVVDCGSGRMLALAPDEAFVLARLDGLARPEELAALARAQGWGLEASAIEKLFQRLSAEGFLQDMSPTSGSAWQAARPPGTVARFRSELQVAPKPEKRGLHEVKDPRNGKVFTLYDFEVSLAQLLDGHRTPAEVIEAAAKNGIPVSPESFERFIARLRGYGLLEAAADPGGSGVGRAQPTVATTSPTEMVAPAPPLPPPAAGLLGPTAGFGPSGGLGTPLPSPAADLLGAATGVAPPGGLGLPAPSAASGLAPSGGQGTPLPSPASGALEPVSGSAPPFGPASPLPSPASGALEPASGSPPPFGPASPLPSSASVALEPVSGSAPPFGPASPLPSSASVALEPVSGSAPPFGPASPLPSPTAGALEHASAFSPGEGRPEASSTSSAPPAAPGEAQPVAAADAGPAGSPGQPGEPTAAPSILGEVLEFESVSNYSESPPSPIKRVRASVESPTPQPSGEPPGRKRLLRWVVLGLFAVGTGAGLVVKVPNEFQAPCQLQPTNETPVVLTQERVLKEIKVTEKQWVDAGTALASVEAPEAQQELEALGVEIESLQAEIVTARASVEPKALLEAEAGVRKAERGLGAAQKKLLRLESATRKTSQRELDKARSAVTRQEAALDAARQELAVVDSSSEIARLNQQIAEKRTAQEEAARAISEAAVPSPAAGLVRLRPEVAAGHKVASGEEIGSIIDPHTLTVIGTLGPLEAELVKKDQLLTVQVADSSREGRISLVGAPGSAGRGGIRFEIELTDRTQALDPDARCLLHYRAPPSSAFEWSVRWARAQLQAR